VPTTRCLRNKSTMDRSGLVILVHRGDDGAARLAAEVTRRGTAELRVVTDHELASRARFVHIPRTGAREGASAPSPDGVWLDDDTELSSATLGCVYSRLVMLPSPGFSSESDREYAAAELHALIASWLHGLGRTVVNPVSPLGLAGAMHDLVTTITHAQAAGLAVPRIRMVSNDAKAGSDQTLHRWELRDGWLPSTLDHLTPAVGPPLGQPAVLVEPLDPARCRVLVTGDQATGAPDGLSESCRSLARISGLEVCEVVLAHTQKSSRLVCIGVDPLPRLADSGHIVALAVHLTQRTDSQVKEKSA